MGDDRDAIQRRSTGASGGDGDRPDLWQDEHPRVETLSAYLGAPEEFAPTERATIDAHLAACTECSAVVVDLRALVAALTALPEPALPRSFALTPEMLATRDLPRGLEPQPLSPRRERQMAFVQRATAVAAVLFVVVLGVDAFSRANTIGPGDIVATAAPESIQQSFATSAEPGEDSARNAATAESSEPPNVSLAEAPQPTEAPAGASAATPATTTGDAAAETPQTDLNAESGQPPDDTSGSGEAPTTRSAQPPTAAVAPADDDQSGWGTLAFGFALLLAWLLATIVLLPRLGASGDSSD